MTGKFRNAIVICFAVLVMGLDLSAQTVGTPVHVGNSATVNSTLGIPRWKGYMSENNPNWFWLSYASGSTSANTVNYTTDAGATFSTNTIQVNINGWVDYHLSLFGRNDHLYFTWPGSGGIRYRHFNPPAHSDADRDDLQVIDGTSPQHRANVCVQPNGRVWLFTRLSGTSSENVRYKYSDNDGATWTSGTAFATNHPYVRIGSMPYINGNPALVVLHLDDPRGYEYYLWNGSSFEAKADHSIFAQNIGQERAFTHQVVSDTVFHLLFGLDNNLHHVWKNFNNGNGSWNSTVIETSPYTDGMNWAPIATVQGDDLYVFFCRWSNSSRSSSQIYYKKWNQNTQTWTDPVRVSTAAGNVENLNPNSCFRVPDNADYIPVFWRCGGAPYDIYFNKIMLNGSGSTDTIPPAQIDDLDAETGSAPGEIDVSWTAPGDDDMSGTASDYEIRYAQTAISDATWNAATVYGSTPTPATPGTLQQLTLTGLSPGILYYVGVRAEDEVPNTGPLSNVVSAEARVDIGADIDDPEGERPERFFLSPNYPNPFNPSTTFDYALPVQSRVQLTIYNELGQAVRTLADRVQPAGSYTVTWDGRDDRGVGVASGVYFYRLTTDQTVQARKMILVK